jgi:archaellum biogenesis ATPase FlaH
MISFLETLYPDAQGFITIWTRQDERTTWLPIDNLPAIAQTAHDLSAAGKDVYFGVGLAAEPGTPKTRTKRDTVSAIPGFWFDFDIISPVKKNVPATIKEVIEFLRPFPFMPSIIVDSGHGVHAYWLLREMWYLTDPSDRLRAADILQRLQKHLCERALTEHKWKFDKTSDLCRILRLPGTQNYKFEPVPVNVIHSIPDRYNPDDFDSWLPDSTDDELTQTAGRIFETRPTDGAAQLIIDGCRFIQHCRDDAATLPEPEWYAALTNLSRAKDGLAACHAISEPYPRYSAKETNKKYAHARSNPAPQSCEYIRSIGFQGCPAGGCGVKNPASFALSPKLREKPKPKPKLQSAAELEQEDIPDLDWIIPDIIPAGLTLLVGAPKIGKSWLALAVSLAAAYGGKALGKIKVEKKTVLYLGLEDTKRRLKSRLMMLACGEKLPGNLYPVRTIPKADQGGLEELEQHIIDTGAKLVIIDTFQMFRRNPAKGQNAYTADTEAVAEIKALADKYGIGIVLVHHENKSRVGDFVEKISGSFGVSGAADTILTLTHVRLTGESKLTITGRDVDTVEYALRKDKQTNGWTLMGTADEVLRSYERRDILNVLRQAPEGLTPTQIAEELGKKRSTVQKLIGEMVANNEVFRAARGTYRASPQEQPF